MCTRCFITWIEEGYYNYCDLPIGLKKRLSEEDQKKVESLHNCEEYTGRIAYNIITDYKIIITQNGYRFSSE